MTQQADSPGYPDYSGHPGPRRLVRSRDDRWLGGVCGGVARYAGLDPTLVRLLTVLGTLVGFGSLVLLYLVAWVLMPQE